MNKYGPSYEKSLVEKKQQLGKDYVETYEERVARLAKEANDALKAKLARQDLKGAFVGEVNKGQRLDNIRDLRGGMH